MLKNNLYSGQNLWDLGKLFSLLCQGGEKQTAQSLIFCPGRDCDAIPESWSANKLGRDHTGTPKHRDKCALSGTTTVLSWRVGGSEYLKR